MRRSVSLVVAIVVLGGMLFSLRIAEASQYTELLLSQGIEEMGRGEYEKALERFQRAAESEPDNPDVHYFLGLAYSRLGDYPSAIAAFEKALNLDPQDPRARYELGMVYFSMEDYPKALASFKRAHRDDPSNALVSLYLGATYQGMGQHGKSIRYVREARELDPNIAQMSEFYLAMAYVGLGRYKEATETLQACIEMNGSGLCRRDS
jgi:tetratricopeptide (TPR) repeat protein